MNTWVAIAGMGLVTLLTRALPLLALRDEPPAWLRRWLAGVPVALFTALALRPLLVSAGSDPRLTFGAPCIAGVVGAVVAWYSRNVLATIAAGMLTFWLLRWLGARA